MKVYVEAICKDCERKGVGWKTVAMECAKCSEPVSVFMSGSHPDSEASLIHCPICDGLSLRPRRDHGDAA